MYTFFTQPKLFQRYVAAAPAIGWDNEVIYQYEKKYFENKNKTSARLYLCEGGVERGVPMYQKFVSHLIGRHYKNMQLKSEILENTGHSGTKGEGYERGLQFMFERPSITLQTPQLKNILGTYQTENGTQATIQSTDGKLILKLGNNSPYTLYAANEQELYAKSEFLKLGFTKNDQGSITGFVLERFGDSQTFKKIK
jgi:hypothetical protein